MNTLAYFPFLFKMGKPKGIGAIQDHTLQRNFHG